MLRLNVSSTRIGEKRNWSSRHKTLYLRTTTFGVDSLPQSHRDVAPGIDIGRSAGWNDDRRGRIFDECRSKHSHPRRERVAGVDTRKCRAVVREDYPSLAHAKTSSMRLLPRIDGTI